MRDERKYESELHRELGMTDAELRDELRRQGLDPEAEAQALRSMIQRKIARFFASEGANTSAPRALPRFPVFDEAVAAGAPVPDAGLAPARADLMEVMRLADPSSLMWCRVSGWSMRDEGIRDGDMVLVDRRRAPRDGDIVLAHLAGRGQVIKRLRLPAAGGALLESANAEFAVIAITDPSELAVHGVVVGRAGSL